MNVDTKTLKNIIKGNSIHNQCKNHKQVLREFLLLEDETIQLIKDKKCKDVIPYILWNNFVNDKGTLAPKTKIQYKRYVWGQKVFVDFGATNIQTELSFPHPAIVLFNFANTVIIVPTTTDDKTSDFSEDIEESIIKVKSDNAIFPKNSVINIHQIMSIHKERIINDLGVNVKNYIMDKVEIDRLNENNRFKFFHYDSNLLDCIRLKINLQLNKDYFEDFYLESAYTDNEIYKLNDEIKNLKEINKKLELCIDEKTKLCYNANTSNNCYEDNLNKCCSILSAER